MLKLLNKLTPNQTQLGFILTLICIKGLFALAFIKGVDILGTLPVILATYVGARTAERGMAVMAASKDPNANTHEVIRELEHGPRKPNVDNPDA